MRSEHPSHVVACIMRLLVSPRRCERWHKIADHLRLFSDLAGPLFGPAAGRRRVSLADVPASLRHLDLSYLPDNDSYARELRGLQD